MTKKPILRPMTAEEEKMDVVVQNYMKMYTDVRAERDKEIKELMYDVLRLLNSLSAHQGREAMALSDAIETLFNIKLEDRYAKITETKS